MRRFLLFFIVTIVILYFGVSWYFASQIIVYREANERTADWIEIYAPPWAVSVTDTV